MTYNHKIRIYKLSEVTDDIGQIKQKWTKVFDCWACVTHIGGKEYYAASQTNSQNDIKFHTRYSKRLAGISTLNMRIEYNSKFYDVRSISDYMEKHTELEIRCSEIQTTDTEE